MKRIITILLLTTLILSACKTGNSIEPPSKTFRNSTFRGSEQNFNGQLSVDEYKKLRSEILNELGTTISENRSILINYDQSGEMCILNNFDENSKRHIIKNRINISSKLSKKYNIMDFFVYHENSLVKSLFPEMKNLKADSGYFYANIFNTNDRCSGFFILKPNGKYKKYYGEDYYSEVEKFMRKN